MKDLAKEYVDLLVEKKSRQTKLSGERISEWGSDDHVADLEARLSDAIYWRDSMPRGSEKRSHYRAICSQLKTELQSARKASSLKELHIESLDLDGVTLNEGGLVGHLQHLYDNQDLKFKEIKTILRKAATGRLEKVSEKMDGMNLVFSYDVSEGAVKVTRGSDIKSGGMDASALAAKFAGRGSVEEAFNTAFKVLQGALESLPTKVKTKVFGPSTNRWYSMEIIYTKNPNVINYDSNNLVFHGWPVFQRDRSGDVSTTEDTVGGVDILTQYIDRMQNAVESTGWKVRGPAIVRMRDMSNGTIYQETISKIDSAMAGAGIGDGDTLGSYLEILLKEEVKASLDVPKPIEDMIVSRCLGREDAPTLVDIKKKLDKSNQGMVSEFVKNSPALLKRFVRPIELAINDFAVEVLKGLESTLIDDSGREVERLRGEVGNAISAIESSGDETSMSVLAQQMEKLKSVENITSPMEGVVFIYKGNAYKFTGSFAAANQVLGLFKYGRKGAKLKSTT